MRRITFVLTNGKRLNEAWEINDLFLGPREQDLLWRALKEARLQAERNYLIREANAVYRVDFAVICREGTVGVTCGDEADVLPRAVRERLLHFTPAQIDAPPQQRVAAIVEAADPGRTASFKLDKNGERIFRTYRRKGYRAYLYKLRKTDHRMWSGYSRKLNDL